MTPGSSELPAVIASDLDGTLLRSDGSVSRRTREVLRRVEAAGVEIVLVTARPPRWLNHLRDIAGAHGVILCSNGAFVYDVSAGRVTAEHCLTVETILELAADLRTALPGIGFAVERNTGFAHEPGYLVGGTEPRGVQVVEAAQDAAALESLLEPLPGKLLAKCPGVADEHFHQTVRAVVGERAVLAFSGAHGLAEISAAGVTKAAALADWCAALGVGPERVWAFGDMPNDVPMLTWAGTSFAVAGGHPEALAAATSVCPSNDVDGVAQVLEAALLR
jgi:hydroxymethylpyrimidine pyrophosphatase-like HAD family hydrolase